MDARAIPTVVVVIVSATLFASCGSTTTPTAPSQPTPPTEQNQPRPSIPIPNPVRTSPVQVDLMALADPTVDAHGNWLYELKVRLRETGEAGVTVTKVQIDAISASKVFGAASVTPMLSLEAGAQSDLALVFASDRFVHNIDVTVNIAVSYTDAKANSGQVHDTGSCFGCWDY